MEEQPNIVELAAGSAVGVVFDSVMRKLDTASITQSDGNGNDVNDGQQPTSPKVAAEKYSRTTALLLRAQQLEAQLKSKASAGGPDDMGGGYSDLAGQDNVGGAPRFSSTYGEDDDDDEGDEEDDEEDEERDDGRYGDDGLERDERMLVEETILHAEQAKQNVRRYKKEAEARRKRRIMLEQAEADALSVKIREAEHRRKRTMESHEDQRARSLRERLQKQRREREERKRRRESLFAAEKRVAAMKPKPLHKRMVEDYKKKVELPELERRKKRLADIHKNFTENSPDIPELGMRQRAHQALQRLSGERGHHKLKGRERTWMETKVWYHGEAKSRVLKEEHDKRTGEQKRMHQLRLQVERKKAYDKWVKRVAPPMLDADKVGEMQSRVERLKNPAPKKNARDEMKRRVPRRHNERKEIIMDDEGGGDAVALEKSGSSRGGRGGRGRGSGGGSSSSGSGSSSSGREERRTKEFAEERRKESSPPPGAPSSTAKRSNPGRTSPIVSPNKRGLSHPEDLSARASQLAQRARELRSNVEIMNGDLDDDNYQHAKLQNMYLASMQSQFEKMAEDS